MKTLIFAPNADICHVQITKRLRGAVLLLPTRHATVPATISERNPGKHSADPFPHHSMAIFALSSPSAMFMCLSDQTLPMYALWQIKQVVKIDDEYTLDWRNNYENRAAGDLWGVSGILRRNTRQTPHKLGSMTLIRGGRSGTCYIMPYDKLLAKQLLILNANIPGHVIQALDCWSLETFKISIRNHPTLLAAATDMATKHLSQYTIDTVSNKEHITPPHESNSLHSASPRESNLFRACDRLSPPLPWVIYAFRYRMSLTFSLHNRENSPTQEEKDRNR